MRNPHAVTRMTPDSAGTVRWRRITCPPRWTRTATTCFARLFSASSLTDWTLRTGSSFSPSSGLRSSREFSCASATRPTGATPVPLPLSLPLTADSWSLGAQPHSLWFRLVLYSHSPCLLSVQTIRFTFPFFHSAFSSLLPDFILIQSCLCY